MKLNGDCRSTDLDDVVSAEDAPCVAPVSVLSDSALHLKNKTRTLSTSHRFDLMEK